MVSHHACMYRSCMYRYTSLSCVHFLSPGKKVHIMHCLALSPLHGTGSVHSHLFRLSVSFFLRQGALSGLFENVWLHQRGGQARLMPKEHSLAASHVTHVMFRSSSQMHMMCLQDAHTTINSDDCGRLGFMVPLKTLDTSDQDLMLRCSQAAFKCA